MLLRYILLCIFSFFIISNFQTVQAQYPTTEQDCIADCLSGGGNIYVCEMQCGSIPDPEPTYEPECGNGICDLAQFEPYVCAGDCAPRVCGDGSCMPGEEFTCWLDCPELFPDNCHCDDNVCVPENWANACEEEPASEVCQQGDCLGGFVETVSRCGEENCGGRCVYDVTCVTGVCRTIPGVVSCTRGPGTGLCGDRGCCICERYVESIICCSAGGCYDCGAVCKNASVSCGVNCPVECELPGLNPTPVGGNTPTTAPPTSTPDVSGTIRARAVSIASASATCDDVRASTDYLDTTEFNLINHPSQVQSGGNYVEWTNMALNSYSLAPLVPTNYTIGAACWNRTITNPFESQGLVGTIGADTEVLTWDIGAIPAGGWIQAQGGDVYSQVNVESSIPEGLPGRLFNLDSENGHAGYVSYGTDYDFDINVMNKGADIVSSTNWLMNESLLDEYSTNWYEVFYGWYGGTPDTIDYDSPSSPITKPASREEPYYVTGNMTTSGNWTIGGGEIIIFFVDGDLIIDGSITRSGTGFVAFIASGNISVSTNVGTNDFSSSPPSVLDGIYVTSSTFSTGSSSVGNARLVGNGIFIANSFILQRDLDVDTPGQNLTTSAELFIFDPQLIFLLPKEMQQVNINWSEVAP